MYITGNQDSYQITGDVYYNYVCGPGITSLSYYQRTNSGEWVKTEEIHRNAGDCHNAVKHFKPSVTGNLEISGLSHYTYFSSSHSGKIRPILEEYATLAADLYTKLPAGYNHNIKYSGRTAGEPVTCSNVHAYSLMYGRSGTSGRYDNLILSAATGLRDTIDDYYFPHYRGIGVTPTTTSISTVNMVDPIYLLAQLGYDPVTEAFVSGLITGMTEMVSANGEYWPEYYNGSNTGIICHTFKKDNYGIHPVGIPTGEETYHSVLETPIPSFEDDNQDYTRLDILPPLAEFASKSTGSYSDTLTGIIYDTMHYEIGRFYWMLYYFPEANADGDITNSGRITNYAAHTIKNMADVYDKDVWSTQIKSGYMSGINTCLDYVASDFIDLLQEGGRVRPYASDLLYSLGWIVKRVREDYTGAFPGIDTGSYGGYYQTGLDLLMPYAFDQAGYVQEPAGTAYKPDGFSRHVDGFLEACAILPEYGAGYYFTTLRALDKYKTDYGFYGTPFNNTNTGLGELEPIKYMMRSLTCF